MDIEILHEERLRAWCRRIEIPTGAVDRFAEVACKTREDADLLRVFTELYEQSALRGEWQREWKPLPFDPIVEEKLGQNASLFYLLGYMASLPHAAETYRQLGIDDSIFDATMYDITIYLLQASDLRGYWAYTNFAWIWRHLTCELFRLGRLQFMLLPLGGNVTAFKHRRTGEVLLLADPELLLRPDGWAAGAGRKPWDGETWLPVFEENEMGWRGHPINPRGFALREPVHLSRLDWDLILQHGDTVCDIHIPRGKTLTADECRDSFQQAIDFFARIRPEMPFKAFYCHTWFFSPQLQQMLPPESSIVRFQREFYLYPFPGSPEYLWEFVFGEKYRDTSTAPRDTTLRRAVLDWLARGGEIFDLPGLMFHAPAEWGSQPYMNRWDAEPPV